MKIRKRNLYLAIFLVVQILLMRWITQYPQAIEDYYSNGIYPVISSFFRILLGWIPFSIGDLLIFYFVFYTLRFIYRLFKTRFRRFGHKLIGIVAFFSVIYFCFYLFWGLNYYRQPLSKNLGYETSDYSTEELRRLSEYFIDQLNTAQLRITQSDTIKVENPYSQRKMYNLAREGYDSLAQSYPQFTYRFGTAKSSLMSWVQSYNQTSGYMNPLTGEAQVNWRIPKTGYPTTVCHEMSHQIGYAAENEANFIGFLAALHNKDIYFQYAAYRMATVYSISELRKRDPEQYNEVIKNINEGIFKDFKAANDFWDQYENPLEPFIKKGYNAYLKSNNQEKGIQSYNYVVDLFIKYYKKKNHESRMQFYQHKLHLNKIPDSLPIPFKQSLVPDDKIIHQGIFSPDMSTYYYVISDLGFEKFDIYYTQVESNGWSEPKLAPFNSNFSDHGISFSADGQKVYFSSTRPVENSKTPNTWQIWTSTKKDSTWSVAKHMEVPNLNDKLISHPTVSKNNHIYFHSGNTDYSDLTLYRATIHTDEISDVQKISFPNDDGNMKVTPFISPDERFLMFGSLDDQLDLMISYPESEENWSIPKKLNLPKSDIGQGNPFVTPDNQYLLYTIQDSKTGVWSVQWVALTPILPKS